MEQISNIIVKRRPVNNKLDSLFKKIKSIKNIEFIIAAVFIGIMLLIFFSGNIFTKTEGEEVSFTLAEYSEAVENRMEDILSKIEGAGNVRVMITFESGVEIITANTTNKQSNKVIDEYNGGFRETDSIVESNNPLIVAGKAVIIKEIEPKVKGAVVVSEGAGNMRVQMELIKAVSTLLKIDTDSIEIFRMTK